MHIKVIIELFRVDIGKCKKDNLI